MKNIIQAIKDCCSVRINCGKCGSGESVYFIPESIISKLEVAVAKMETTTSTCKDSLQVGNAAKMCEALGKIIEIARGEWNAFREATAMFNMHEICTAALSAPPRNCDKCLTPKDAMLAHLEEVYEGEKVEFGDYEWCEFVKWLFAEAKGEAK